MIDFLKDASDAWSQRIRSPVLVSIALTFLALNWQPIWYLIFAERSVPVKFSYFALSSSLWTLYWGPLLIGLLIAFITPWVRLGGAWLSIKPVNLLRKIEYDQAHEQKLHRILKDAEEETAQAKLEEARESREIEAARRLESASKVDGGEVATKIRRQRNSTETAEKTLSELDEMQKETLAILGKQQSPQSFHTLADTPQTQKMLAQMFPNISKMRARVELEAAGEKLKDLGLVSPRGDGKKELTKKGFEVFDLLSVTSG